MIVQFGTRTAEMIDGDIARVKADAMITVVNSGGMWFGGIDGVIMQCAGGAFHSQISLPKNDLDTVVARAPLGGHRGAFGDVVFVIDDLKAPLHQVVFRGLEAADRAGYRSVSLPAIRTGVTLGIVEKDAQQAVGELLRGIDNFFTQYPDSVIEKFTFVLYRSNEVLREMTTQMPLMLHN